MPTFQLALKWSKRQTDHATPRLFCCSESTSNRLRSVVSGQLSVKRIDTRDIDYLRDVWRIAAASVAVRVNTQHWSLGLQPFIPHQNVFHVDGMHSDVECSVVVCPEFAARYNQAAYLGADLVKLVLEIHLPSTPETCAGRNPRIPTACPLLLHEQCDGRDPRCNSQVRHTRWCR